MNQCICQKAEEGKAQISVGEVSKQFKIEGQNSWSYVAAVEANS